MVLPILVISVVVFALFTYLLIMVLFPEWVGITGKKAKQIQQSHIEEKGEKSKSEDSPSGENE